MTTKELTKKLTGIETREEMLRSMLYESDLKNAKDINTYLSVLRLILVDNMAEISHIRECLEKEEVTDVYTG